MLDTRKLQSIIRISFFAAIAFALFTIYGNVGFTAVDNEIKNVATITGKLTGSEDCAKADNQIWISINNLLLYHTDLPTNGTFEFQVKPGKYNVIATGSGGCFFETAVELKKNEKKDVKVAMVLNKKNTKKDK